MTPSPSSSELGPELRQLVPEPATVHVGELLASLSLAGRAHADRPYTIVNFVASTDGRAAFNGRSRDLSDPGDRAMFHGLREHVDAILVGTGTLRAERYGRLVRDPERRQPAGRLGPEPGAARLRLQPRRRRPDRHPAVLRVGRSSHRVHAAELDTSELARSVDVVRLDPGELTLTTMMRRLRSAYDVRSLLCEGGPTIFGALLQEDLVDELFLSLAPKLTGGGRAPGITSGPALMDLRQLSLDGRSRRTARCTFGTRFTEPFHLHWLTGSP